MVAKATYDLPEPLGPVMTVNFPSGRSTSMPLRLFCREPRISMQSFGAAVIPRSLFPIFEPTGDSSRSPLASQIFRGAHAAGVLRSAAGRTVQKHRKSGVDVSAPCGAVDFEGF